MWGLCGPPTRRFCTAVFARVQARRCTALAATLGDEGGAQAGRNDAPALDDEQKSGCGSQPVPLRLNASAPVPHSCSCVQGSSEPPLDRLRPLTPAGARATSRCPAG